MFKFVVSVEMTLSLMEKPGFLDVLGNVSLKKDGKKYANLGTIKAMWKFVFQVIDVSILSIVWLWKIILEENSNLLSMFTIRIITVLIIELITSK